MNLYTENNKKSFLLYDHFKNKICKVTTALAVSKWGWQWYSFSIEIVFTAPFTVHILVEERKWVKIKRICLFKINIISICFRTNEVGFKP